MVHEKLCKIYCIKTSSNLCFGYLLELPHWGNSNKYSKHMFCEEIIIKQGLCYISFCPLRLFYNRKFILMATTPEKYAVVVTRFTVKYLPETTTYLELWILIPCKLNHLFNQIKMFGSMLSTDWWIRQFSLTWWSGIPNTGLLLSEYLNH